jgi:hypothetical protein
MPSVLHNPDREERVELAQRQSSGIEVSLLWDRLRDVAAVRVLDQSGGNFELVLSKHESPLDVFHHPYAYAAMRGAIVEPLCFLDSPEPDEEPSLGVIFGER